MRALEDRERLAIRIGLLVLLPAFVGRCGIEPYLGALGGERSQLVAQRSLLAREAALVRARTTMNGLVDSASTALAIRSTHLFQSDPTLAANALVGYVANLASSNRLLVQSSDAAGVDQVGAGPVKAVHMQLQATGDIAGVLAFLRALRSGRKLVRVDQLTLERQGSSGTVATADSVRLISLSATVSGYTLPPALYTGVGGS